MKTGFDRIAGIYDLLAGLIFAGKIRKSQTEFLDSIKPGDRVLILGGGTGRILRHPVFRETGNILFVDTSSNMLEKAKRNAPDDLPIRFQGTEYVFSGDGQFDVVILHYYLDLFDQTRARSEVNGVCRVLKTAGNLIFADFRYCRTFPMNVVSRGLIQCMYFFFRVSCGIEGKSLPDFDEVFKSAGFQVVDEKRWFGGMIRAVRLRK